MRHVLACLVFALLLAPAAQATKPNAVITVTTPDDTWGDPSHCSLREAFDNVNAGGKTGTNSCAAAVPTMDQEFTEIQLNGLTVKLAGNELHHIANHARLSGGAVNAASASRILHLNSDGTQLVLDNMMLFNGFTDGDGGAVFVEPDASLYINESVLEDNIAAHKGGAIFFTGGGFLTVVYSAFLDNLATEGGAIRFGGDDASISHSRFTHNTATHAGGAIYNYLGVMSILDSRIEENHVIDDPLSTAAGYGGGIYDAGYLQLLRVNLARNDVEHGNGGGLYIEKNEYVAEIRDSYIDANVAGVAADPGAAGNDGGGIYADSGFLTNGVSLRGNQAIENGGGIAVSNAAASEPIAIMNTSLIDNAASRGAALWVTGTPTAYSAGGNSPLGATYSMTVLNDTFAFNHGESQIHLEGGAPADRTILFVNNIVHSDAPVQPCSGYVDRLATERENDPDPGLYNAQWPTPSCGVAFTLTNKSLKASATGWYYKMAYATTLLKDPGDTVVCKYIEGRDQFGNPRQCRLGAVEKAPPPVSQPIVHP